jgi:hypothetical protein
MGTFFPDTLAFFRLLTPVFFSDWNMPRYQTEIPRHAQYLPYDANFKFDSREDCAVSVAHGVVQDVFHLINDVNDIRRHPVQCAFLRTVPDSHDESAQDFHVLVWHHLDVSASNLGGS